MRRGGITKAGNNRARRVLIEGAWTYRFPARMSPTIQARLEGLPRTVREIAWKGQVRLCARYRKLTMAGKLTTVVVTAIAREMAAFLWAIGQEVNPIRPAKPLARFGAVEGALASGFAAVEFPHPLPATQRRSANRIIICHGTKWEAGLRWGILARSMWPTTGRRPKLDRGSPRRTHGNAVPNPRIRVCQPSS